MGFFDNLADKFDDAKRSAKRSARKARKKTGSDSTLEAAGKIAGKAVGAVAATTFEFGKAAYDKAVEKSEELNELKDEFRRYDNDRVEWILNHSSGLRKMAAMSVLQERGYDFRRN